MSDITAIHCGNCDVQMLGRGEMFDILPYRKGENDGHHQFYDFDYCHLCESERYDQAYALKTGRDRITNAPIAIESV